MRTIAYCVSRIGGEDGVSLEAMHWMRILLGAGHRIHVVTGSQTSSIELAALEARGVTVDVIPAADPDPTSPRNVAEHQALFSTGAVPADLVQRSAAIRSAVEAIFDQRAVDSAVLENFTLPWFHVAFCVAVADVVRARSLHVVSRGHDFPQDRPAYRWGEVPSEVRDFLERAWVRDAAHVAINSRDVARHYRAMDIDRVTLIPNTIDPQALPRPTDAEIASLRRTVLGADAGQFVLLCPVRPVARKRLDVAIALARRVSSVAPAPCCLLVTHDVQDATPDELDALRSAAASAHVRLVFGHERLAGRSVMEQYALGDAALYLSDFEGFGNALLEVLAFGLPVVVNEYEVFRLDIAPVGFELWQLRIPEEVSFGRFMEGGLAVVEAASELSAQLDRVAGEVAGLLSRKVVPGAPLTGEDRARAQRNLARVERRFAYPAVARVLSHLLA